MPVFFLQLLLLFSFFLFSDSIADAKIDVEDFPDKIEIDKEFGISVSLSNLSDPAHFLSIALHKNSGDPYFGLIKNGDNWVEADDGNCKNFPQASVSEGSWSGKLTGKILYNEKDFDNSLGSYILKIIKYTDSCNKSYSDELSIQLFDPDPPPPTSTPTLSPTVTPKTSNTPKPPTTTKIPVNNPSSSSTPKSSSGKSIISQISDISQVLGEETVSRSAALTANPNISPVDPADKNKNPSDNLAKILIGIGGLFILGAGLWVGIMMKKEKISNSHS